ncbi:MAG TPA: glycosyltransferase [Polyangiaceae bacterium]|nr:glycosyltransferase [Polyangiaceae bacterium]
MKIVLFCHSLLSDWNHGNAHFLRGVVVELQARGHVVRVFEPVDAWSVQNLLADVGRIPTEELDTHYPSLDITRYDASSLDLDSATHDADLVLVHEWSTPELVAGLGARRAGGARHRLLFHDTHHRIVSEPHAIQRLDLSGYDGILAFGEAVRERYVTLGWANRVWTWHEAADTRVFKPVAPRAPQDDLVWIGNWGDDERTRELSEFLLGPTRQLALQGSVYGVRYPTEAIEAVGAAGLVYRGWLPNYRVPEVFAQHRVTVHVPRRPYAEALPGVPTIRVFEALACGIPLISAPWSDAEGLFAEGDFVRARDGAEMGRALARLRADPAERAELSARGLRTILARHTCAHRVTELLGIAAALGTSPRAGASQVAKPAEITAWD